MSGRLRGVDEKRNPAPPGLGADGLDRLKSACDVAGVDEGDEFRPRPDGSEQIAGVHEAGVRISRRVRDVDQTFVGERLERPQDGIVFHTRRDDVIALTQSALDRLIQGSRAIEREDDLLRGRCIDESCQTPTAIGKDFPGRQGLAIGAPAGRSPQLLGIAPHGFKDLRRLRKARGGVVEVQAGHRSGVGGQGSGIRDSRSSLIVCNEMPTCTGSGVRGQGSQCALTPDPVRLSSRRSLTPAPGAT